MSDSALKAERRIRLWVAQQEYDRRRDARAAASTRRAGERVKSTQGVG